MMKANASILSKTDARVQKIHQNFKKKMRNIFSKISLLKHQINHVQKLADFQTFENF